MYDKGLYDKKNKVFAVMRDSQGYTIDIIEIDPNNEKFLYKKYSGDQGDIYFTKGIEKSSFFFVKRFRKKHYYVPYNINYPLPLSFKTEYIHQDEKGEYIELFPSPSLLTPIFLDQKAKLLNMLDRQGMGINLGNIVKNPILWILIVGVVIILILIQELGLGV